MQGRTLNIKIQPSQALVSVQLIQALCLLTLLLTGLVFQLWWMMPLLMAQAALLFISSNQQQADDSLCINESGQGFWSADQDALQIGQQSLLCPFLIALRVQQPAQGKSHWQLIYRDQLDPSGWRRLRRVILNRRHQER
ncbi:hypothetical protein CWE09_03625 [Aliidiomarina minuta]|uniref:Toxin CptA n=1 Tax=Aliidiomarina minuta TaxID=880057 RepID=A0A432W743_9GAMM|nr:protein YgfX [Aliidiomarina minuta]RUO25831.1 hypothetical protein CWE09_03625 [Aliidiomarina minuta]